MPDWRRFVGRRLRALNVPSARRDEIERELAGFLEDDYEKGLRERKKPRAAMRDAIARVGGWPELTYAFEREEGVLTSRLKTLWIPGFVVALAALALTRLPHARWGGVAMVRLESQQLLVIVWTWLLMLPLLGALGAEWSRRQGGARREQLLVSLAPAFALAVLFGVMQVLLGHPSSQFTNRGPIPWRVMIFVNVVLIPSVPILLGCLPALARRGERLERG